VRHLSHFRLFFCSIPPNPSRLHVQDNQLADRTCFGLQHKLKTLTLCGQFNWNVSPCLFVRVFSTLQAPNLKRVFLKLEICDTIRRPGLWTMVDRALDNRYMSGSLCSVEVSLMRSCFAECFNPSHWDVIREFPSLVVKGLLKIVIQA
jgi:hypothetical protein